MLNKNEMIDGKYYAGICRNTNIAMWHNDKFIFINFQFDKPYIEDILHYSDVKDINTDGFIPIRMIEIEYEEIKNAKLSQDYKNYFRNIYSNIEMKDLKDEIWKDIIGYETLYQISNYGRIKNLQKNIICKQNFSGGYLVVGLTKNKLRKTLRIHRLVAHTFKSKDFMSDLEVNHINGIKTDNRISNLEWVSHEINSRKTFSCGNKIKKLSPEMVSEIKLLLINKELKQKNIAKKYNISESIISEIKTNKKWKEF